MQYPFRQDPRPQSVRVCLQEVSIMRKVRHKNVVQFIGACTRQPNLCILVEYMAGGSVYDYVRRKGLFSVAKVVEIGHMVAKGALCCVLARRGNAGIVV